nr:nascent polypeptide-associated complex subunit alpha, muscle-specific form-like [Delphinus delphis]
MDFNLHCPCFHKGSLVTVPGVPWFKDPALRSQETSLQSSNGREAESNDVTRGESAGGLPTSPARFIEPSTGKTPAPHPPRRSGTLEIARLDASLASSSPRGGGGEVDNLAASTTSDQRAGTPGARDAKTPDDRPIPPAGAGAPATLPARRPPMPGSRDPGRSRSALPARTVPSRRLLTGRPEPQRPRPAGLNRRLTPHGASQQPLRGYGHEPETPHAGPQEAPGPLGSRPLSGAPNLPHSLQGANFHTRTRRDRLAAPASASRYGACARRPRPHTGARAGARGTPGAGVFPPLSAGRGGGGVRSPTRGTLTCRHLSLPQSRLRPLRTLPRPSHSIPAVARAKKLGVSSDCSLFHTPRSQSSDPACSTGKYVQSPTTSHANTRPAGAPPPSLPGLLKESAKGPLVPTPARHLSATYRRSGQLDPIERERESSVRTEAVRDLKTLSCWLGRCRKGPQDKKCKKCGPRSQKRHPALCLRRDPAP